MQENKSMDINQEELIITKLRRGRPKTKTDEELKETKRICQKNYMKRYERDYTTKIACEGCGLVILKCNYYRHKNSKYHLSGGINSLST